MARCNEYKPSGFDWISDISNKWDVKRLRFVCEFRNGYTPSKANPDFWTDGTIPWYRMEDIRDSGRYLNEAKQYITEDAVKGGGLFDAGSFILATTATIGEHAVLIVDSLANQRFTNLKIRKSLTDIVRQDFFFYYLYVIDNYCKSTTNTATFASVNMNDLRNVPVPIPPIDEQKVIVDFIEKKCASIDKVIATQEQRIALLEELKQSIITEAVTRGLNSDAPLRDSGIEWIGKIPEHWEICRFKNFMRLITTASTHETKIGLEHIESGTGRLLDIETDYEGDGVSFENDDIVYGKLRPYLQKVWLAEFGGNAVGDFFVFRAKENAYPHFLKWLMLSSAFTQVANSSTTGAKMPRVSSDFILALHYALPPIEEQRQISDFIDIQTLKYDRIIVKARREVELLNELKLSIITEAVTGKVKVC